MGKGGTQFTDENVGLALQERTSTNTTPGEIYQKETAVLKWQNKFLIVCFLGVPHITKVCW